MRKRGNVATKNTMPLNYTARISQMSDFLLIHRSAWKGNSQKFLRSWNLEPSVLARIAYFHVPDESVSDAVDVLHLTVQERTAVLVEHTLMNLNHDTSVWLGTESLGFDNRVDGAPLARPIRSHAIVSASWGRARTGPPSD